MKRIMIAAPKSGSGKTLITCALLRLLKRRGLDITSFKCGPDYIDPMFHRTVLGVPGGNLDSFFSDEDEIRSMISRSTHEYAVFEGVMGLYDGVTGSKPVRDGSDNWLHGSSYDIARITDTPVILVMDVKGMGQTMLPVISGILSYDTHGLIRGVILNRISPSYYEQIAPLIREEISGRSELLGGIPVSPEISFESRHLGLVMPDEIRDIAGQIYAASDLLEENIDTEKLFKFMSEAEKSGQPVVSLSDRDMPEPADGDLFRPVIAAARDEAFCFYYEENLRMLREAGMTVCEFSPLHDSAIPKDADAILLGGGYPELYAEELSNNTEMKESICKAVSEGMPSLAECGGFMYLLDELKDQNGCTWPMCGLIRGRSRYTGKLSRFGYINIAFPEGLTARGHEFHYFDSDNNGTDAHAVKPVSGKEWDCIHMGNDHIWGYPHLWYRSCPQLIFRLREEMIRYHSRKAVSNSGTDNINTEK